MFFKKQENSEQPELVFDNRRWRIDLQKLESYCFKEDSQTEITEGYDTTDGDMKATSKVIREIKAPGNSQDNTVRYDLIKMFLTVILNKTQPVFGAIDREQSLDFSFNVAFNTLLNEGILIEIKQKDE